MTTLVLDFDSTFVTVESLDELGRIALRGAPDRAERMAKIERLTNAGMDGRMSFGESLAARLKLFAPRAEHISELVKQLHGQVTPSVAAEQEWFLENAERIYIVSGGFREYIVPVVREFGIAADHVLANRFIQGPGGEVIGYDTSVPIAGPDGKAGAIRALGLTGKVVVVGDGYTDWEVRAAGVADVFVAYTGNVERTTVTDRADARAASFDEILDAINTLEPSAEKILFECYFVACLEIAGERARRDHS